MIIHPNLTFRADILPRRARKVRRSFAVRRDAPIMVRETTGDAAPVVLSVPRQGTSERDGIRLSDGRFWRAIRPDPAVGPGPEDVAALHVWDHLRDEHVDGLAGDAVDGGRDQTFPEGEIVRSHEAFATGVAQAYADDELLAIDGVPHVRVRSPVLRFDELVEPYGEQLARGICPEGILPAWFPLTFSGRSLGSILTDLAPDGSRAAARVLGDLDVVFLRPDLLPTKIEGWGALTDLSLPLRALSERRSRSPRPHEGTDQSWFAGESKDVLEAALARTVAEAASASGPVAALAAASAAMKPLPGAKPSRGPTNPAPAVAESSKAEVIYYLGVTASVPLVVHKQGGEGWTSPGTSMGKVVVEFPTLGPSETTPVLEALPAEGHNQRRRIEIVSGPLGTMLRLEGIGFAKHGNGGSDVGICHASQLASAAWLLCARDESRMPDGRDHFGDALASDPAPPDPRNEAVRSGTLTEFAKHRLVDVDGLTFLRCPEPLIAVHPPHPGKAAVRMRLDVSYSIRTAPGPYPPLYFVPDREDEALRIAVELGGEDRGQLPDIRPAGPALVRFDTGLWNLRSALLRIVPHMDRRVRFLGADVAAAVGRAFKHLEAWSMDPRLVEDAGLVADFLEDATTIVPELSSPVFGDVGGDWAKELAVQSLVDAATFRNDPHVSDDDAEWDLSM